MRCRNKLDNMIGIIIAVAISLIIFGQFSSNTAASITQHANTSGIDGSDTYARGTYTFSQNVSNGELVNITNGAAVYLFEFNTTNLGRASVCQTTNCIIVNLSGVGNYTYNESVWASGNLTAAINANASTAAIVTASNTTNLTTITADTLGTSGNSIALADNAAGVTSSGLSGGSLTGYRTWSTTTQNTYTATANNISLLWYFIPLFIIIGLVRQF